MPVGDSYGGGQGFLYHPLAAAGGHSQSRRVAGAAFSAISSEFGNNSPGLRWCKTSLGHVTFQEQRGTTSKEFDVLYTSKTQDGAASV